MSGYNRNHINRILKSSICCTVLILLCHVCVHAKSSDISVNNYVIEEEKAFTAEDLRRLLKEGNKQEMNIHAPLSEKEKLWERFMSLSVNEAEKEKTDTERPDTEKTDKAKPDKVKPDTEKPSKVKPDTEKPAKVKPDEKKNETGKNIPESISENRLPVPEITDDRDQEENTGNDLLLDSNEQIIQIDDNDTVSSDSLTGDENTKDEEYYIPPAEDEWMLLLVNKQNPIPDDYDANLIDVNGSIKIRTEIALPLSEMFDAAEEDGISLMVCSAYRSHDYQQGLFDRKIRYYTGKGYSYLDAFRLGSYSVIIPGTSEYELGMALDIVTPGYTALNEGFADTNAGRWLKDNAYKYGFILRYPEGKEYITGITYEPWHFRYVGIEAAKAIEESGLTLEEYVEEIGYHYD